MNQTKKTTIVALGALGILILLALIAISLFVSSAAHAQDNTPQFATEQTMAAHQVTGAAIVNGNLYPVCASATIRVPRSQVSHERCYFDSASTLRWTYLTRSQ